MSLPKDSEVCQKCSFCCSHSISRFKQPLSKRRLEYHTLRSVETRKIDGYLVVISYSPCKHYKDNQCTIYKDRPSVCREFPLKKQHIFEDDCELYRKIYKGE